VLLAEPHHSLAEGIRSLLGTRFEAVVMVADETSLIAGVERLHPQLTVVELALAHGDVRELIARLRCKEPDLKVLLLSVHDEQAVAECAIAAGADGFVVKRAISTDLLPAVEAILRGERYVTRGWFKEEPTSWNRN
jgi:DNA-binding NarL/FixJ family response regulator